MCGISTGLSAPGSCRPPGADCASTLCVRLCTRISASVANARRQPSASHAKSRAGTAAPTASMATPLSAWAGGVAADGKTDGGAGDTRFCETVMNCRLPQQLSHRPVAPPRPQQIRLGHLVQLNHLVAVKHGDFDQILGAELRLLRGIAAEVANATKCIRRLGTWECVSCPAVSNCGPAAGTRAVQAAAPQRSAQPAVAPART